MPTRPDFKILERDRPKWRDHGPFTVMQTRNPCWKWGEGSSENDAKPAEQHISIDPRDEKRTAAENYKLLISAIIPRPVALVSTLGQGGKQANLAPLSYFQIVNHDPPVFVLGFAGGTQRMKDTLRNVLETKECVINMISENFLEAANAAAVNAPYGISEWDLTGLTPAMSDHVKPSRVEESVFSIETVLTNVTEFDSRKSPGKKSGAMVMVEGVKFWMREDAQRPDGTLDPGVLRPISRLGGVSYGRTTESAELPRPEWTVDLSEADLNRLL